MDTPIELCRTLFGSVPVKSRKRKKPTSIVDGRTPRQMLVDTAKDILCGILEDIRRPKKQQKDVEEVNMIGDDASDVDYAE